MTHVKRSSAVAALISLAALTSAEAAPVQNGALQSAPVQNGPAFSDPLEATNRAIFAFNHFVDRIFIRPVAVGYKRITPRPMRVAVHNFASNLGEPVVAINDFLQGRAVRSVKTLTRFAANTTVGVLGVFDVASTAGLTHHANDFGITLARYGVKAGPYLVLPILGPSSVRDATGGIATIALNPLTYVGYPGSADVGPAAGVETGVEQRAAVDGELKTLYASATDPYAYMRSLYLQHRQSQINDGRIDVEMLPSFDDQTAVATPVTEAAPVGVQVSVGNDQTVVAELAPGQAGFAPATEDRLFAEAGEPQ